MTSEDLDVVRLIREPEVDAHIELQIAADLGVNLQTEFENHTQMVIGGACGLTRDSEDGILRLYAGYEFE